MTRQTTLKSAGFTLIELAIVMTLVALTSTVATVYISGSDNQLRNVVRNLRFDLERAKNEAVTRNTTVFVAHSWYSWGIDCNDDGAVTSEDYCYVIYEDHDGSGQYTPGLNPPEEIKKVNMDRSMELYITSGHGEAHFTPFGETRAMTIYLVTASPVDEECCDTGCMQVYYPFKMSRSGRVDIQDKESGCDGNQQGYSTCVTMDYCDWVHTY